jgi:hypothetical protein
MSRHTLSASRFIGLLAAGFLAAAMCHAQSPAQSAARVREDSITIPTYELGPPDPNPALASWQQRKGRPVYPYTVQDNLTNRRVNKTYKAVRLENEYLRVTVLPELGGRLYEIFDKTTKRDVLYTNHVVKYALVAVRGAWISGGIEWGFLDAHTVTTVSPVDYATRTEGDGSAAVTVGDTERVQGMQWAVTIRLRPRTRAIETEVTLNNRRETAGRHWYWSVGAAEAADDLRFVFPVREVYAGDFWPIYSFPKEKGVDVGTYREITNAVNLHGRNSKRNFFGIYYEKSDRGVVHVADYAEVPGKTLWTWGTDDDGKAWVNKLTDADGQYVEFEAGRFETMMDDGLLGPHRVEHFTEHWFPVGALGGPFDEATPAGALRVTIEDGRARVAANFTSRFDGALFVVETPAATIHSEQVNLSPESPFVAEVNLPDVGTTRPLTVVFKSRDGRELIRYRTDTPVDGNADFKPATRPVHDAAVANSAEQIYLAGLAAEKRGNDAPAREAYREALKRDPGFAQAHTRLSLSFYRGGEYERAAAHALLALGRNRDEAEAHYYLGLARRAERRWAEAAEQMSWLVRAGGAYEAIAHYQLGEMALALGHNGEAVEELSEAVRLNPVDIKGRTVLALAERLAGRLKSAEQRIGGVLEEAPLDYLALAERAAVSKALGHDAEAARAADELWRLLGREPDSVLELAFDYAAAGQVNQSRLILEEAIRQVRTAGREVYPMLHYALGHFYEQGGDTTRALAQYRLGAQASPALVFPHRVEEIEALSAAFKSDNRDGSAAYYLGNVLAARNRGREALAAWRDAVRLDPANGVARRNLALALWQVAGQKGQALAEYKQALNASAEDYHLYLETDRLMAELGQTGERVRLLEAAPALVRSQSAIAQALAAAYADAERFADAARLLEQTTFTSGEGEYGPIAIYRKAHLGLARGYEREGKYREAAAEYLRATEYPLNLGAGRHAMQSQAREYVAAARALELAGERVEAEKWWQRAAEDVLTSPTQPEEPWSEHYYWKAVALERVGKKTQAEALYRRLARLADEEATREAEASVPQGAIRFALAGAGLKALGQREHARAALEQALKMEPGNELAHLQLADLKREQHARDKP